MRVPLLAYPWRVSQRRSGYRGGHAFWRIAVYGLTLAEPCECDNVQDCIAYRWHGVQRVPADEDGPAGTYDPRVDCTHRLRPPHRHWSVGLLYDRPIR